MGWSNNSVFQVVIITGAAGSGLFVYSPTPGPGHLVASIAATGGKDAFGNAYIGGITAYLPGLLEAVGLSGGQLSFLTAPSVAGPWSIGTSINQGPGSPPVLNLNTGGGGHITAGSLLEAIAGLLVTGGSTVSGGEAVTGGLTADTGTITAGLTVTGGLTADNAVITSAANTLGSLLNATNQQAAPASPPILLRAQGGTDRLLAVDAAGDTSRRLTIGAGGAIAWGSGSAGVDTFLSRTLAGLLQSSYISFSTGPANVETWNPATFANSWANAASGPGLQFRRVAAPDFSVQWIGRIVAPAGIAAGQAVITAVGAAYQPTNPQGIIGVNIATGATVRFTMTAGGVLTYQSGAVAGNQIDIPGGTLVALTA